MASEGDISSSGNGKVFDVVVVGTGLVESIVAAAAARAGKRVLHIDDNECYGGVWASLPLEDMEQRLTAPKETSPANNNNDNSTAATAGTTATTAPTAVNSEALAVHCTDSAAPLLHCHVDIRLPRTLEDAGCGSPPPCYRRRKTMKGHPATCYSPACRAYARKVAQADTWQQLLTASRRFNLDLSPKLCHAKGELVQLLIAANIGRYLDFRPVAATSMLLDGVLRQVPCSKQTLLLNTTISPRDKRSLVRFMQFCMEQGPQQPQTQPQGSDATAAAPAYDAASSFSQLMRSQFSLSDSLCAYVTHAIADVPADASASEGIAATRRYLMSLNVYGATPFIYPLYGFGEVTQAFCRLCAVFGGVYMLRTGLRALSVAEVQAQDASATATNADGAAVSAAATTTTTTAPSSTHTKRVVSVRLSDNEEYLCSAVVAPHHVLATVVDSGPQANSSYLVYHLKAVTSFADFGGAVQAISIPPLSSKAHPHAVTAMVFAPETYTIPEGRLHWHLFTRASPDAAPEDVRTALNNAFDAVCGSLKVHAAFYYAVPGPLPYNNSGSTADALPSGLAGVQGVFACSASPDSSICADEAVREAHALFARVLPGEEFLPAAPNPEDVVWDHQGDDNTEQQQGQEHQQSVVAQEQSASRETAAAETATTAAAAADVQSQNAAGPQESEI
eukprot:m.153527 g.153527  ORF g.153527 m.153527 type:complete len:676 (+) comp16941_c0_seq5:287-2314(+)